MLLLSVAVVRPTFVTLSVQRAPLFLQSLQSFNSPNERAVQTLFGFSKSCSQNRKKNFVLGLSFSVGHVTRKGVFALFWLFFLALGTATMIHFWTQYLAEN